MRRCLWTSSNDGRDPPLVGDGRPGHARRRHGVLRLQGHPGAASAGPGPLPGRHVCYRHAPGADDRHPLGKRDLFRGGPDHRGTGFRIEHRARQIPYARRGDRMTHAENLPAWAALLTAFLVLLGAGLTLLGAIGTLRFGSFFERVHAPTLGTSWGTGAIVLASIVCFSALGPRPIIHELLIGGFITATTPVSLMLLARAALYRSREEGKRRTFPLSPALACGTQPTIGGNNHQRCET